MTQNIKESIEQMQVNLQQLRYITSTDNHNNLQSKKVYEKYWK